MRRSYILKKYIEYYLFENNLTKEEFCELCDIDLSSFNKLYTKNQNINLDDLVKISKYTGISTNVLLVDLTGYKKLAEIIKFYIDYHKNNKHKNHK